MLSSRSSAVQRGVKFFSVLAAALVVSAAAPAFAQTVTKTGRDLTTQSTTETQAGRTVRYAISLGLPAGQTAASLSVTDAIPPGLQYVAGSLLLPGNAAGSWSTNGGVSYVGVEPAAASSVTNLRVTGNTYMAATSTLGTLPTPPVSSANGSVGGDGYRAIPYNGKVYSLYHHNGWGNALYCGDQATGSVCPGFPTSIPKTAGSALASGTWYETSLIIAEFLDRTTGRIYFWVKDKATNKPAVVCADLQSNTSCGSYVFSNSPDVVGTRYFTITGGHQGSRFYANGAAGRMLCFDTATFGPCAGTDSAGTFAVAGAPLDTINHQNDGVGQIGSRLFWQAVSGSTSQTTLVCFDMATNAACPGFNPVNMALSGGFMPTASASGVTNGFCLGRPANITPTTACYDLNGVDVTAAKTAFATYVNNNPLPGTTWGLYSLGASVLAAGPVVTNSRSFWQTDSAGGGGGGQKLCWDWVTDAPCAGYNPTLGYGNGFYEASIDPGNSNCVWSLGDGGRLGATSAIDGGACKVESKTRIQASPAGNYCDGQTHVNRWARLQLMGLTAADYESARVTIRDANGAIVGDWNAKTTTFPVDLSAYSATGNTANLVVEVELLNITNVAAFSADPKPYVSVSWTGDPQQVCFDAKLVCESPALASTLTNTVSGLINGTAVSGTHSFTNVAQACWVPQASNPNPVPALDAKAMAMLSLLLAALGWAAIRRRSH